MLALNMRRVVAMAFVATGYPLCSAFAQKRSTIRVPSTSFGKLDPSSCTSATVAGNAPPSGQEVRDTLVVGVFLPSDSAEVGAPDAIVVLVGQDTVASLAAGAKHNTVSGPSGSYTGKSYAVLKGGTNAIVCSGTIAAVTAINTTQGGGQAAKADAAFLLVFGAEYTSVDSSFRKGALNAAVTAAWTIPFSASRYYRANLEIVGERTTSVKRVVYDSCHPFIVSRGSAPPPGIGTFQCAERIRPAGLMVDTVFLQRADSIKFATAPVWRVALMPRAEWRIGGTDTYVGVAGHVAVATPPSIRGTEQLAVAGAGGVSISMLAQGYDTGPRNSEPAAERLSLQIMYGPWEYFGEVVRTGRSEPASVAPTTEQEDGEEEAEPATPTVRTGVFGLTEGRKNTWQVRALFRPVEGWYIRAHVHLRTGGPDLAQLGILKTADFAKLLEGLGLK